MICKEYFPVQSSHKRSSFRNFNHQYNLKRAVYFKPQNGFIFLDYFVKLFEYLTVIYLITLEIIYLHQIITPEFFF